MALTNFSAFRHRALAVLLIATACGTSQSGAGPSAADSLSALRAADSTLRLAVAARDAERTAGFYAEDAVLMPVAEPIVEGRAAILEEWRHVFGIPGFANTSRLVAVEQSTGSDLAFTRGTYESRMLGPNGDSVIERGKWVSVWKRQADGQWRIVVDIFNTDSPPPDHQASASDSREH